MSLYNFQKILLDFYTNEAVRESFSVKREKFLEIYELSKKEQSALAALDIEALTRFAKSLLHKMLKMIGQRLLGRPGRVILAPWRLSSPSIFFLDKKKEASGGLQHVDISEEGYVILKALCGQKLSPREVMLSFSRNNNIKLRSAIGLLYSLTRSGLWGKMVIHV